MFTNYLKIAVRNLFRHKAFSFINIFGLALGMTCSILIMLWVKDELSFNQFHSNADQLYRVVELIHIPGGEDLVVDATPNALADALEKEFPEILYAAKTSWEIKHAFYYQGKAFKESGYYASPEILKMFTFPLRHGNIDDVLKQPHAIVISERMSRKYFGNAQAVGKVLKVNNQESYQVSGVMQDVPKNSTLQFDYLMPIADLENKPGNEWLKDWKTNGARSFVMLRPDAPRAVVDAKIKDFLNRHLPDVNKELFLQPVKDIYLYPDFRKGNEGQIRYVRLFSAVAIFVLVIACINYMNLSTARSARRAREVGVRKVIGAGRFDLIWQFIGESVLISLSAVILSVCLTQISLPAFNTFTGKSLSINYGAPEFYLFLVSIAVVTGILSGSYPALVLSAFHPAQVLKGSLNFGRGVLLRKGLVIFQFVLSAVLIVCALVVHNQVHFMHSRSIGLNRENVVYIPLEGELAKKAEAFKNELRQAPGIKSVTASDQVPLTLSNSTGDVTWQGKAPGKKINFSILGTDDEFASAMEIALKEGRFFSKEYASDSEKIVLNEEAVRQMKVLNPLNMKLKFWGFEGQVIGVVKDFHTANMRGPIQPLIMVHSPGYSLQIFARIKPGKTQQAIASLRALTKKFNPAYPFEYHFMDDDFEAMYKSEAVIGRLANCFAGIAIIISCLGLFGLALFTAEQRTKEIGIRKVLGASVTGIVAMLTKDFLKLVLLANIIAWPLGWSLMNNWLQSYAFRVEIGAWVFVLAGMVTLFIALLTVSFQAVRSASTNPVASLRRE